MPFICTLGRHVVKFLGWSQTKDSKAITVPEIVLQFAKHGSLRSIIVNKKLNGDIVITYQQKVKWSDQIADAVCYMHAQKLIHRDIKPANVLVDDKLEIKLVCKYNRTHVF